mmetsp:Transcript_93208/g.260602  ORF Transcript_93208/g.260602 Transcript_93208/m.260602 type:complete len:205 (-) Transcript_93208:133-747(-)
MRLSALTLPARCRSTQDRCRVRSHTDTRPRARPRPPTCCPRCWRFRSPAGCRTAGAGRLRQRRRCRPPQAPRRLGGSARSCPRVPRQTSRGPPGFRARPPRASCGCRRRTPAAPSAWPSRPAPRARRRSRRAPASLACAPRPSARRPAPRAPPPRPPLPLSSRRGCASAWPRTAPACARGRGAGTTRRRPSGSRASRPSGGATR